ncbi:translocase of inner mitochondrial membrane 8-like protein B [Rhinolophus ferrumequinum]|uniref:Mitochondrial import inner membrane translocase subunit n=1 Tax=Rhinolophus ferrumequinum TaxID=59479 RepID=A0A7J7WB91_RHIFE|nr:translocase of inner mitochondrial membrane 8-like protein B [Rhinolophus ferrumequinum]
MAELGEADEAELQRLVAAEQQKAQFTAQVHHFMELCWDKCVEKPGNRLDSRTENCLSSCVDRFIDTTLAITRFSLKKIIFQCSRNFTLWPPIVSLSFFIKTITTHPAI